MLRTAAGRRALQLAFLVGGLFMLGFLCGEQAHAAEGAPVSPVRPVVPAHPVVPVTSVLPAAGPQDAVRAVTERVATPVRDVVHTASQVLEETRAKAPTPPAGPAVPLPKLPEGCEPPVHPLPAPVTPEPRPHRHDSTAPAAVQSHQARTGTRAAVPAQPTATGYGPHLTRAVHVLQAPAHAAAHPATAPVGAPSPPQPTGDPDGVLGKQAVDGTASRHGDAHAVTPDGRAPLRLLPGTAARVDAPRTRERHRDIPVFPG
ncbi:hypothetical protein [Streptomyces sp. NPDC007905]|uniref:hypothetical protein n=1 Tax=Streptomyces sp. NPDC007905 TaxID=3364788 RepID=UPI0036E2FBD1